MKKINTLRVLGAAAAGVLMLGATMAGAVSAATTPTKSWWIDPATGEPNVVLAVGASANASDVVSAAGIAAAVGNMATVTKTKETQKSASVTFDNVMEYNYSYQDRVIRTNDAAELLYASYYIDHDLYGQMYWETREDGEVRGTAIPGYDVAVALAFPADVKVDSTTVAKGLSTLWFSQSPNQWDASDKAYKSPTTITKWHLENVIDETGAKIPTGKAGVKAYAGGSYDDGDDAFDFKYSFFDTGAWLDIGSNGSVKDSCDYIFGGTGTLMEPHEEIQVIFADKTECKGPTCAGNGIADLLGEQGHISGIVYRTAEIRYPILENGQNICGIAKTNGMVDFELARQGILPTIKFLGKNYNPLFAGRTVYQADEVDLGGYFVYGKPKAEKEKIMRVGEQYVFGGYTIILNDINIYENKAYWTVSGPGIYTMDDKGEKVNTPFTFIQVMDSMGACTTCCPDCAAYGGGGAFTSNPTKRPEYDPYVNTVTVSKTKNGKSYTFFKYADFMLDGIKTFVGADGTYLAEVNLYALDNMGYLEGNGCCDPFVTTPNDYGLAITGGWRKVSLAEDNYAQGYPYATEGTAEAEEIYMEMWEDHVDVDEETDDVINAAYVLWTPQPSEGFMPDANYDTLELQLCDDIVIPDCETDYSINGPENYFKIVITDLDYGRYNKDTEGLIDDNWNEIPRIETGIETGIETAFPYIPNSYGGMAKGTDKDGLKFRIEMDASDQSSTITYTETVKIDPLELVKLDIELNPRTINKNIVLVGGPVFNSLVKDLVDNGSSTVNWFTSQGEWEWVADPYAVGNDVLIVAGANREETRRAANDLVAELQKL